LSAFSVAKTDHNQIHCLSAEAEPVNRRGADFMRILAFALLSSLTLNGTAFADGFGCSRNAGATIFFDSLYGLASGAIFSGLYIWSKNDEKGFNREKTFANGTMIGGVLGFGLGITEVSLRNCPGSAENGTLERSGDVRFAFAALPIPESSSLMSSASVRWIF
jgi:hypothetical protein